MVFLISPESSVNIEFITVSRKKHDVSGFHQALCSFYLGKDSHVTVTNVSNHTKQCVTEIYSTVFTDENAVYSSTDLHFNSETHKVGFRGYLNGKHSQISTKCASLLLDRQRFSADITMYHKNESTISNQFYKYIVNDYSQAGFDGMIHVDQKAKFTEAYQLNKNLVLSDNAKIDSNPALEIFTDDVKASHGSTSGMFDPENIYYLQSRGLTKKQAQQLLLKGFVSDLTQSVDSTHLQAIIENEVNQYIDHTND